MMDLEQPTRRRSRVWPAAAAALVGLVLLVLAFQLGASTTGPDRVLGGTTVPSELDPVVELYAELQEEAVEAPDSDELVEGALEGMLDSLDDPYAYFYDEMAYAELNRALEGEFTGVGLVLEDREDGPVIVSVIEGAPADEAGVAVGERIVEVDGEDVTDLSIEQLVADVTGDAGTEVTLTFDGGDRGRYTVTVTREEIEVPQIEARLLDDGAGYVRLLQFTEGTAEDLRTEVQGLLDGGAGGIVLDLRGNPGGFLDEAIEVASVFVEDGPVVSVQERVGERQTYEAVDDAIAAPLVVLVDAGSASASEIVAGAVQDRDRGTIVGEQTFGKGTVQTIRSLPDGLGAKFTTARYYTPSGRSIEETGVTPDRVVAGEEDQLAAAQETLDGLLARR